MDKITIVIREGRVENVYGTNSETVIEIIDLDTQDAEELESLEKELEEVKQTESELM